MNVQTLFLAKLVHFSQCLQEDLGRMVDMSMNLSAFSSIP